CDIYTHVIKLVQLAFLALRKVYTVLRVVKFIDRLLFYERRNVLKLRFAQKCIHSFNLYVIKNEVLEQRNLTLKFFIKFRRLLMLNYRLTIRYYRPRNYFSFKIAHLTLILIVT